MKSIMEEASSIVKAIEAAWIRAEKPQEFSVKIFEEPEKNFFGMVTKSAKIALIFKHVEKKLTYKEQAAAKYKSTSHTSEPTITPREYPRKESSSRHEPITREPRESRETRESRIREPRENREPRESRETRDSRIREPREQREPRERENREYREPMVREPREREVREPRESRENREPREAREQREPMVREPREREIREPREPRERREPFVRDAVRREPTSRPSASQEGDAFSSAPTERQFEGASQEATERVFWTEEMVEITKTWIDTLLKNLQCDDITFTLEPKRYYLTVSFSKPVRETKALEQQLFRSCAYLIMQMLRTTLKKQFRGLKVVLHSPA